ncbi:hypothetical protein QBC37DRAFT_91562 [Rhypophila decipiens]|uniref:F-box domain-containing protein n=1 Tax=Rhypophila decipiens TaxID=261697 RepID=A0AAN6YED4_9PEZI|nr:hypothetical protein QBC37DRAFT_91562 [Rhypophila decipiens]
MSQGSLLARLPEELLLLIFEVCGQPSSSDRGDRNRHPVPEHIRTIQSLRLTCRQFYRISSPLLIPSIRIDFRQSSIDRLRHVSNHPLISRGIRSIKIMLDVFSPRLPHPCFFQRCLGAIMGDDTRSNGVYSCNGRDPTVRQAMEISKRLQNRAVSWGGLNKERLLACSKFERVVVVNTRRAYTLYVEHFRRQGDLCERRDYYRGAISPFPVIIAGAIAQMSGRRARSVEFVSTHRDTQGAFLRKARACPSASSWENFFEPLVLQVTHVRRDAHFRRHPDRYAKFVRDMILQFSTALQSVQNLRISDVSFDLESQVYPTSNDLIPALTSAFQPFQPKTLSFIGQMDRSG